MGEDEKQPKRPHRRGWVRWTLIVLGVLVLTFIVFHGPILRAVIRSVAQSYVSGQNLKLEFQLDGDPIDQVTLRNLRATPTGPSAVQTLKAGTIKVDYSLWNLLVHGLSDTLKNVEVHDLTAVIDPAKAPVPKPPPTPAPNEKITLPAYFPDRLEISNFNLTIRGQPQETVVRNFNLGLYPDHEGALRIDRLQIPNVHSWSDITATTTYRGKNLFLRNLTFDQGHHFQTVNIDASKAGGGNLELQLSGTVGEGKIEGNVGLSTTKSSFRTRTKVSASGISLGQLSQYFGRPAGELEGDVKNFQMDWQGTLDEPQSWAGTLQAQIENVRQSGIALDQVVLEVVADKGTATVREARVDRGTNHLRVAGTVQLPKEIEGFRRTPGDLRLTIDAPNLREITAFMPQPLTGSLRADGTVRTENSIARLELTVQGDLIGFGPAAVQSFKAHISATKKLPATGAKTEPFYANLISTIEAELHEVHSDRFVVDRIQAAIKTNDATVSFAPLEVQRKANRLIVQGNYQLPPPGGEGLQQPADLQFTLNVPELGDYWEAEAPDKVTGQLQGNGRVQVRNRVANGSISVTGQQIAVKKLVVRQLALQTTITNNLLQLTDLTATINDQDYLQATGEVRLEEPFQYKAKATAHLADLSAFEPLLNAGGPGTGSLATNKSNKSAKPGSTRAATKTPLAGSLVLDWNGQGSLKTIPERGDLHLRLERGRYADLQNLEAQIEAHYTPQRLEVPILYLGSDKLNLQASVQTRDSRLEISNLQVSQAKSKYASGYVAIPFEWSHLGTGKPLFPPDGKVQVNFQTENLDLTKLFRDLGKEPPVSGELTMRLDAGGPIEQLQANLNLRMQNLASAAIKRLEPAKIDVAMSLQNNELKVLGKIEQARIQPVRIDARFPLNLSQVIEKRQLDPQTPVTAKIEMPRSPINFVREFVPALRQLDGSLALNVNVDGTIAKPAFSGAAEVAIVSARFENPTLPALSEFNARLNFRDNALRFDRFAGNLAGGPFTLSGTINFPSLIAPRVDLRLKADSILVARNDNLTARVDADIKVEGPVESATVSGEVLTTNSRFLKNIDIIPIALPGRPAPHPEPPSAAPELSFPDPPLRDWKFDLTIKSKDPFSIRGNLATGRAIIDMKIAGTGLHPQLQGQVRLENFEATLPFSTLSINLGFVYFTPDDPLNPRLELQGTSLIRDYTIHVYVYGTANAPQAVFSSEPPLPQEEIIALLATGTTREELGTGNVLASRAAILLVKQLYRKVFKKGAEPETEDRSFFNRLDVEFGNTDPRTGEQTATARYKVSDHVVLIGDLGTQGGFRGLVKYLIRFR